MNIIVVGCGKIGTTIVASLSSEGHDVVAVDENDAVVAEISDIYDVMCVCGNGADYNTLSEAGVEKADMLISVTAVAHALRRGTDTGTCHAKRLK